MNYKELKDILLIDRSRNIGRDSFFHKLFIITTRHSSWLRWKYIKYVRLSVYYEELYRNKSKIFIIPLFFFLLKKNHLGNKLGFEIGGYNIGRGISLCHIGFIIINGQSKIGDYCTFHGDNCIGNDGITDDCPIIGNGVDIGVGAIIIGGVRIADNVKIGAGAVVVNDILEEGSTVVGIPARMIKR